MPLELIAIAKSNSDYPSLNRSEVKLETGHPTGVVNVQCTHEVKEENDAHYTHFENGIDTD
jgi:hypothetical protein